MRIRSAERDEAERIGCLTVAAYATLGEPLGDYVAVLRDVAARLDTCEVAVAEDSDDGSLLGTLTYVPGLGPYAEWDDPDAAGIRFLAVDPAARGRGVAEALVRWAMARAEAQGRARLLLHTTDHMHTAQRLYERLGFVRAPELDWWPRRGVRLLGYRYERSEQVAS